MNSCVSASPDVNAGTDPNAHAEGSGSVISSDTERNRASACTQMLSVQCKTVVSLNFNEKGMSKKEFRPVKITKSVQN